MPLIALNTLSFIKCQCVLWYLRCKQPFNKKQLIKGSLRTYTVIVQHVFTLQLYIVLSLPLSSKVKLRILIGNATTLRWLWIEVENLKLSKATLCWLKADWISINGNHFYLIFFCNKFNNKWVILDWILQLCLYSL